MHFAPIDVEEEREFQRRHDMTDFSAKNRLPGPQKAEDVADVLSALEVLALLVTELYCPMVTSLVDAARRFLLTLRKTKTMRGRDAVPELVAWINDCFERFRSCLVREDLAEANDVKNSFHFNHESYVRVVQRVTSLRVDAVQKPPPARKPANRHGQSRGSSLKGGQKVKNVPVPPAVVAALPIRKGKRLCMKYLSVDGCPGEGEVCVYDYRGHFVPTKLPGIVKTFINKAYGGLKSKDEPTQDPSSSE